MLSIISKEQQEANKKELQQFCKDNHCEMWNYMLNIKRLRYEAIYNHISLMKNIKDKYKETDKIIKQLGYK